MARAPRRDKKGSDERIIQLNAVGLSSRTIARMQGLHPSTISNRLKDLGIEAVDTRRSFMEDVIRQLSPKQQHWLLNQVGPHRTITQLVTSLIVQDYLTKTQGTKNEE